MKFTLIICAIAIFIMGLLTYASANECVTCELAMKLIDNMIDSNTTKEFIIDEFQRVCKEKYSFCQLVIMKIPEIIDYITMKGPSLVCSELLHLCD